MVASDLQQHNAALPPGARQRHVVAPALLQALLAGERPAAAGVLRWWQRCLLVLAQWPVFSSFLRPWRRLCLPPGEQVCVVGSDAASLELALGMAAHGRRVSVVEAAAEFAVDLPAQRRDALLQQLHQASVVMINHSRVVRIDECTLLLDCAGSEIDIPAQLVVLPVTGSTR